MPSSQELNSSYSLETKMATSRDKDNSWAAVPKTTRGEAETSGQGLAETEGEGATDGAGEGLKVLSGLVPSGIEGVEGLGFMATALAVWGEPKSCTTTVAV